MMQFTTKQTEQIKWRLSTGQKIVEKSNGNPRLNSQHCISKEAVSTRWVGESLTHPGSSLTSSRWQGKEAGLFSLCLALS